jgi:hypothetical protein
VKSFCSLEKRNLCPPGPHKTAVSSPSILVLNTSGEYLFIRSKTNFSGFPKRNSRVSPMMGHPKLPGGRFLQPLDLRVKAKTVRTRTRGTKATNRKKAAMVDVKEVIEIEDRRGNGLSTGFLQKLLDPIIMFCFFLGSNYDANTCQY